MIFIIFVFRFLSLFVIIIKFILIFFDITLLFFFFNDTATTEIYTLSLHDALPICRPCAGGGSTWRAAPTRPGSGRRAARRDRKSTRLNSSHSQISYAVFCLKKKKKIEDNVTAIF